MSRIILGVDFGDARTGLAVAGRSRKHRGRRGAYTRGRLQKGACRRQRGGEARKSGADRRGESAQHERLGGSEIGEVPRLCGSSRGGDRDRNGALRREADDGQRASVSFGYRSEREEAQGKRGRAVGDADPSRII